MVLDKLIDFCKQNFPKKVVYQIEKQNQYNLYLEIISNLALSDDINISPFFVEITDSV